MRHRVAIIAWLILSVAATSLAIAGKYYGSAVISGILAIAAAWSTLRLMSKADRDVELLLGAVRNGDTSLRFNKADTRVARALNEIARILHRERVRAAESDRTYSLILQAVSAGIIVTDSGGYVVKINEAALKMFGLEVLPHIDRLSDIDSALPSLMADARGGARFQVSFSTPRLLQRQNVVVAVSEAVIADGLVKIFVFDDIARELDSREVESWSRLTRVLIHEIINSLTPITSISHTILSSPGIDRLPDGIHRGLEAIGSMSEGLSEFVDNFRTLSSPLSVEPRLVELRPLLENMVEAARSTAPDSVEIRIARCDESLMIYADMSLTVRVITNILSNALTAVADETEGEIKIAAYCNAVESVVIDISNNGPEIEPATAENIFVPFFTTRPGGQGIGLALSRQIMKAHGGNVVLLPYGSDGHTVFRITFP